MYLYLLSGLKNHARKSKDSLPSMLSFPLLSWFIFFSFFFESKCIVFVSDVYFRGVDGTTQIIPGSAPNVQQH